MAFPVEGVALAVVNDVLVSAPVVNLMLLVGVNQVFTFYHFTGGNMFDRDWGRSWVIHTTGIIKQ